MAHELGIDLRARRPQRLTEELAARADVVVTMPLEEVRRTRDETRARVRELVNELG